MAILKFGTIVTGVRGTVDGNIFCANKSGPYLRGWARPSNPRSLKQNEIRSGFTGEAQAWATLSDAQRTGWEVLAADVLMERKNSLGETYNLSGFQQFAAINLARITTSEARRTTAPAAASQLAPTSPVLTVRPSASGGSSFTFVEAEVDPNKFLVCFMTFSRSEGQGTRTSNFRLLIVLDNTDTTPATITNEINALFGDPVVGWRYFMTALLQTGTGIRSAPVLVSVVAT